MRLTLTAIVLCGLATDAIARVGSCGQGARDLFAKGVEKTYEEVPGGMGAGAGGAVVTELFLSPTGSFTIVSTNVITGMSCIIASGERWRSIPLKIKGTDS